jgi:DNA-binding beta-propeller fold protein YncE
MHITHALLAPALLIVACMAVPAAAQPTSAPAHDRIYVVNLEDSSFSVIGYPAMNEITRKHVGPRPYYVAVNGANTIVACTVEGDSCIKFYDAKTFTERGRLHIGRMYSDHMMTLPDGKRLILSDRYGNAVVLIDMETMSVLARIGGVQQPHNIRIGASGRYAYVTTKVDAGITVIDLEKLEVRNAFRMKFIPRGLAASLDETRIYCGGNWINSLFEYDAVSGKLLKVMSIDPPAGAPIVQESTYHGLEFFNDSLLLATNEGNSTLDLINVRTGRLVDRTVKVAGPGAIGLVPGEPGKFLFTNMGDNTIVLAEVARNQNIRLLSSGRTGERIGELPKRFTFASR